MEARRARMVASSPRRQPPARKAHRMQHEALAGDCGAPSATLVATCTSKPAARAARAIGRRCEKKRVLGDDVEQAPR